MDVMTENTVAPKLRFVEFKEDWEIITLNNFLFERKEKAINEPLYSLTIENGIVPKSKRYERGFLVNSESDAYKLVKMHDFAYNPMNLRFGAIAMHKESLSVALSKYYNIFHVTSEMNSFFLETYLTTYNMIQYYNKMSTGTLEEKKRVHYLDFIKFKLPFPKLPEQQKIASFLSAVDEKLQQLTKKKELLAAYKKGVIQKIFSQELRFKDANGNDYPKWEKKKLGDLAFRITEKNRGNKIQTVLTNSATRGIVSQCDYFDREIANKNNLDGYYIVEISDFVYNPRISKSAPVGPIKKNNLVLGLMSPLYSVFRFNAQDVGFFEKYFETTAWHRYMKSIANYGARHDRMNITNSDFFKMPIPHPSITEQKKISNFLSSLDRKIDLVSTHIENTRTFKKGLLQQMFV
jgi:type I restriction enzyme S subunit